MPATSSLRMSLLPSSLLAFPLARPPTSPFRLVSRARVVLLLPLLAWLAGCGSGADPNVFPPACPRAAILGDAADVTRYRPDAGRGGQDLTDMVLDGRITGVSGKCVRGGEDTLEVTVTVGLELMRGPAMRGRSEEAPFFLAVSEGQRILAKQVYRLRAEFPANIDRVRLSSDPVNLSLPIESGRSGAAYDLLVGFQLSPEELALNRRRGPR
jgi:hypothetical protein